MAMMIPRTIHKMSVCEPFKFCDNVLTLVKCFSTTCAWTAKKKASQYGKVDTERYSSLVKAVMSSRVSSQTPESLEEEDRRLYGPIVKSKASFHTPAPVAPKMFHPLMNEAKIGLEYMSNRPARVSLLKGLERSDMPSVTRVLQLTMSPEQIFFLERWKRRMIAALGEEGFKSYTANLFRQGKLFHAALENALDTSGVSEEDIQSPEDISGYMESVRHVMEDISDVRAIESAVHHQSLKYVGIVDCVAQYKGTLCAIEWKTSEKSKPSLENTFDNPVQVAAYVGALNSDEKYHYQIMNGLIVVAYKDGSPAHPHFLDVDTVAKFWKKWLLRLELYNEK